LGLAANAARKEMEMSWWVGAIVFAAVAILIWLEMKWRKERKSLDALKKALENQNGRSDNSPEA
jgi:hypothetical protein